MKQKTVAHHKLVGLTRPALLCLRKEALRTGKTENAIINERLCGAFSFGPIAEHWLKAEAKRTGSDRIILIEQAILNHASTNRPEKR
jgi:hypothetical protein